MEEIDLKIDRFPVQSKARKLKVKWTVNNPFGTEDKKHKRARKNLEVILNKKIPFKKPKRFDIESVLTNIMSNEIAKEIDKRILNKLIKENKKT